MKTSIKRIKEFCPCRSGLDRLLAQLGEDFDEDKEFEVSSLVGGVNTFDDITWLLQQEGQIKSLLELGVFCYAQAEPLKSTNGSRSTSIFLAGLLRQLNDKPATASDTSYRCGYRCDWLPNSAFVVAVNATATTADDSMCFDDVMFLNSAVSTTLTTRAVSTRYVVAKINAKLIEILDGVE